MSNISKEEILEKINKIDLTNEESIFSTKLIEDILIKDGHIQISILANNDNY